MTLMCWSVQVALVGVISKYQGVLSLHRGCIEASYAQCLDQHRMLAELYTECVDHYPWRAA